MFLLFAGSVVTTVVVLFALGLLAASPSHFVVPTVQTVESRYVGIPTGGPMVAVLDTKTGRVSYFLPKEGRTVLMLSPSNPPNWGDLP